MVTARRAHARRGTTSPARRRRSRSRRPRRGGGGRSRAPTRAAGSGWRWRSGRRPRATCRPATTPAPARRTRPRRPWRRRRWRRPTEKLEPSTARRRRQAALAFVEQAVAPLEQGLERPLALRDRRGCGCGAAGTGRSTPAGPRPARGQPAGRRPARWPAGARRAAGRSRRWSVPSTRRAATSRRTAVIRSTKSDRGSGGRGAPAGVVVGYIERLDAPELLAGAGRARGSWRARRTPGTRPAARRAWRRTRPASPRSCRVSTAPAGRRGDRALRPTGRRPGRAHRRSTPAAGATRRGSSMGARSTSQTPSGHDAATRSPTSVARRVFPTPPGPVSVTSRPGPQGGGDPAHLSSRPWNDVGGGTRLWPSAGTARTAGNSVGRPGPANWNSCTGSRSHAPGTGRRAHADIVEWREAGDGRPRQTSTWPPWAADITLAAWWTASARYSPAWGAARPLCRPIRTRTSPSAGQAPRTRGVGPRRTR